MGTYYQRNFKEKLLEHLDTLIFDYQKDKPIYCAEIHYSDSNFDDPKPEPIKFICKVDSTQSEIEEFLNSLDFVYYGGPSVCEFYGVIWHNETQRSEFKTLPDGTTYWDFIDLLEIPDYLRK